MIIDAHAHLSDTEYGNSDLYQAQLREAGIDSAVVVPGGMMDVRRMTDYITGRAKPEKPCPDNAYLAAACSSLGGRLTAFACIDPHDPQGPEMFETLLKSGFRGLKLSPMSHQFSFASKGVAELAEICGTFGVPVYTHTVFSPGASTAKFVSLARRFPKVNFILGHMGFGPADQEGLEAAIALDNFFLETSTGSYLHIKESVRRAGPSKVIFGSEFPLSHPKAELAKILLLGLKGDDLDQVLGGNIAQLTGISLRSDKP
ncbi:amidohydrolase family protein [Heliobacterium gestii]|uniref:Amidohydrolase family protein n=1 Tax=Heliomicrobium gestii TaxID=2699 RepID=A0A845LHZ7_HELGE|nr:amidohydrolase family protein [Heliomicrobium gestii]MBM7866188.1 putative TIM-barrel fold metal-dependent hydrolase [Heliomicrobium gestii]MZP42486.1 amidohydrolase family protein [Heliomicrobium gestii]